jgi:hypothetical protein
VEQRVPSRHRRVLDAHVGLLVAPDDEAPARGKVDDPAAAARQFITLFAQEETP